MYQPDDEIRLEVRLEEDTVWLTQAQIAILFGTKRPAITKHLTNIYNAGELDKNTTCSILEHMGNDGKQRYVTKFYNLDAILSVGYRVNSRNASLFRQWASSVLKEYLLKGYSVNQRLNRLEQRMSHAEEKIDFFVRTSSARTSILLIDNYVDESVLLMLSKRNEGVRADIYTNRISGQFRLDLERHNSQYPPVEVHVYKKSHDRFLIIDGAEVYHIGASLKDLGRKMFAFSKLDIPASTITGLLG